MKEAFSDIFSELSSYYGNAVFLLMTIIAGVFLMLKDRKRFGRILIPALLILVVLLNPFLYIKVLSKLRFWRFIWLIPGTLIIGLAVGELIQSCKKFYGKLLLTAFLVIVICLTGRSVFEAAGDGDNTNLYRLSQHTVDVGSKMLEIDESPRCVVAGGLLTSIRQFSGDIEPMFGRDVNGFIRYSRKLDKQIYGELSSVEPDYAFVFYHARRLGYNFVSNYIGKPASEEVMKKYGYEIVDTPSEDYILYYNKNIPEEPEEGFTWKTDKKGIYCLDSSGKRITHEVVTIDNVEYRFNKKGYLVYEEK